MYKEILQISSVMDILLCHWLCFHCKERTNGPIKAMKAMEREMELKAKF